MWYLKTSRMSEIAPHALTYITISEKNIKIKIKICKLLKLTRITQSGLHCMHLTKDDCTYCTLLNINQIKKNYSNGQLQITRMTQNLRGGFKIVS